MALKNSNLGGTDWGAEDLYYQDLNDTFNVAARTSLFGVEPRTSIARLPDLTRRITLGAGAEESKTNVTNSGDVLHTTTTGAYSVTFPAIMLPNSKQHFGVYANAIVGSKIADVDISHNVTSTTDIVSNVGLYKSISFGFTHAVQEGTSGGATPVIRFNDGATSVTVGITLPSALAEEQIRWDGAMNIYFGPSHDEAIIHYTYNEHRQRPGSYAFRETANSIGPKEKWVFANLSSLGATVALQLSTTVTGTAMSEFQTWGATGYSDNEFDDFVTISISTNEGSSWTALTGNGIPASAAASGSSIKVKLEGTASASDEYLIIRDVSIVPIG